MGDKLEFVGLTTSSDLAALGHLPLKGKARATAAAFSKSLPLEGKVAARRQIHRICRSAHRADCDGKIRDFDAAPSFDADG